MPEPDTTPAAPVAYGDGKGTLNTYCVACPRPEGVGIPLAINDVNHWEQCRACGRYVVDVAREQRPSGRTETGATIANPQATTGETGDTGADSDGLREQIRRALAGADGFDYDHLEPHDYQQHVDAVLAARDQEMVALRERLRKAERAVDLLAGSHRRAEEAEAALAAGIPLVCSDERHQAKVTALEASIGRARKWIAGEPVTARSSFGEGYREALRDISDLLTAADQARGGQ